MSSPTLAHFRPPTLVDGPLRLTPEEVLDRADRVAATLPGSAGRPVAFVAESAWTTVVAYFACWRSGAAAVPLHHRSSDVERANLLARLDGVVHLDDIPGRVAAGGEVEGPRDPGPDALAVVLATSGSSGRPKLVHHTSGALARKGFQMVEAHGLEPEDVVLMPAPFAHVSGLQNGILLPGAAGMTTVVMSRWSAPEALRLIADEKVSFMIGPPTYFLQLQADPAFSPSTVESLRLLSCGGAGVSADFARTAATTFGAVVKRTYGSTEAPTITTSLVGDDPEKGWTTDGRPVGDVELRLDGEELLVRGSEIFRGYDDGSGRDADGWFRTGDRASLDADGWLTCLGRIGDTIIRGGENVDPHEVAQTCALIPGITQAVAVGYPDEVMGARVGLAVVAREAPTLEAVRAFCTEAGLSRFKLPERLVVVDPMPVLTVGKPDLAALRALLVDAG